MCFQELEFQSRKRERVHGDKFVESIGIFVKVAQASCSELEDSWEELKQKVQQFIYLFLECFSDYPVTWDKPLMFFSVPENREVVWRRSQVYPV